MDPRMPTEQNTTLTEPVYVIVSRIVLGIVISSVNAFLLLVIFKYELCTYTNKYFFTASLGVTDLLVGLSLVAFSPFSLPSVLSGLGSRSGRIAEAMFATVLGGMLVLSIIQMSAIAIERYLYIARPFFYERNLTPRAIRLTVAVIWIIGLAVTAIFGTLNVCMVERNMCYIKRTVEHANLMMAIIFVSVYYSAIVITCVCYVLILVEVRRHRRAIACSGAAPTIPKWREHIKSLKFFLTVFGVYFIMTCPSSLVQTMNKFERTTDIMSHLLVLLYLSNSVMNFIILTLIDSHFYGHIQRLVGCKPFQKDEK